MVGRKVKVTALTVTLLVAVYLSLPFMLIPMAVSSGGGYAGSILNVAYSPFIFRLNEQNTYRTILISYAKGICAEYPGKCKDEPHRTQ